MKYILGTKGHNLRAHVMRVFLDAQTVLRRFLYKNCTMLVDDCVIVQGESGIKRSGIFRKSSPGKCDWDTTICA